MLVFDDKTIGNQSLTPDWVKWLWTAPVDKFNVTVIEFSQTALKVLSRTKYKCLTSAVPVENEEVSVFQYSKESLNFAKGRINKVIGKVIEYGLDTEELSCGFPLLNEQLNVVGIHVNSEKLEEQVVLRAINIGSILDAFKTYITEQLGGRTGNEMWLEKINLIPENEFELIGAGGYGRVYKIKMKVELNELTVAVKIVQGVNKTNDYKSQVVALEKEYEIVTALDNHPRIIQFFAIVRNFSKDRIMILMEYLEGGSLAYKLNDKMPLPNDAVLKYLEQILEGVYFLHNKNIYHCDIKPANILFNKEDNVKLCDFGISVGVNLQTESSASTSRMKGDFHYMSPERLNNAPRSAANDIWSIGATFVQMISGKKINHQETFPQILLNILQYKIVINGMLYNNFLQTLSEDDFKREIISRTLCIESNRANCAELLSIVGRLNPPLKLVRRLPKQTLINAGEKDTDIFGMSYNSARDELFFADYANNVVRAMRLRDNAGDLRDLCKAPYDMLPFIRSVCHMSHSDTLLVCSGKEGPDKNNAHWLVALSRNYSEWREAQRVQTDGIGRISCTLSDSRVLIGDFNSTYMELFRVESGSGIARVHRIHVLEAYCWFSATCGRDTLVAMTYSVPDQSVRVHRLLGDRLEELARINLNCPDTLLWLADRLLVADRNSENQSHAVIELELSDTRLERRRELIATSDKISVRSLCALNDGLAIFDSNSKDILYYSYA